MTEDKGTDKKTDHDENEEIIDENAHFDMYHFYRRKDVILVAALLLFLVVLLLYLMTGGGGEPAGV